MRKYTVHSAQLAVLFAAGCLLSTSAASGQTWPTEVWPATAAVDALNGTTDSATGLPYIALDTDEGSSPPLITQIDRRLNRQYAILAAANAGRVVKTNTLRVGVFPLRYVLSGTRKSFTGATDQGSGTLTGGDDVYYIYLDNANALQIVTDATGWPADITSFVPLAEVTVSSSAISAIDDRRTWATCIIPQSGGAASTGTDSDYFIMDQDNGSAGASSELRFNRGSTDDDAAIRWNETDDRFDLYLDTVNTEPAPVRALSFASTQTTGTAPLTVASTTLVANLNADSVDGLGFGGAPAAANALPYSTSTSAIGWTAAASGGDVLYANSGVPTWAAPGATSGVQAYDADVDAIAALSSTGLIARTGTGTMAVRTITAGDSAIAIANGSGTGGNPTVAITGMNQYGVLVGTSTGSAASLSAASDNTVMVGNSGANPSFRKIVNADINSAAAIHYSKIDFDTFLDGVVGSAPSFAVGAEAGDVIEVTVYNPQNVLGAGIAGSVLFDVWLSDSATEATLTGTAATSITATTGSLLTTVSAGKHVRAVSAASYGELVLAVEYTGGAQLWYVKVSINGRIYSQAVTFS